MASGPVLDDATLRAAVSRAEGRGYLLLSEILDLHDPLRDGAGWVDEVARVARDRGIEVVDDVAELSDGDARAGTASASTDGVRQYLNAIGRIALLTPEEEVDLAKRYRIGLEARRRLASPDQAASRQLAHLSRAVADGDRAQERLVTSNLRLVVSLARRRLGQGLSLLELIQEGNLGLMRAVEKFDHTKGYKFSTYATWWIRQALTRGTASTSRTMRLPVHVHELVAKVRRTQLQLIQELGREASDAEVGEALGLTADRVRDLLLAAQEVASLDSTVGEDGDTTIGDLALEDDVPGPEELTEARLTRRYVEESLAALPERDREILSLRYGLDGDQPRTLDELGDRFGVTRERVRQIERNSLAKLRHASVAARRGDLEVRHLADGG